MARITNIDKLLFPVKLCPIFTKVKINGKTSKIKVPNNSVVVNSKTGKPFSVVGSSYKLISNRDAIELGRKCAEELFGSVEGKNIEVFNFDAPSTASYCHIDLVHKNYIMNLWDEETHSDVYIPYIRITNSYNTSRALRFDIGLCRKICFNGVIFESETIKFTFNHVKSELNKNISFSLEQGKVKALFDKFVSYANKLKEFHITTDRSLRLIIYLFRIKTAEEIDSESKKEDRVEYDSLIREIRKKLAKYIEEFGENGYSLFNVITDIASHPINNRYFRRDMNSMQRLAGNWINTFQDKIQQTPFDIENYLKLLKESPNKALRLTNNRYAATGR